MGGRVPPISVSISSEYLLQFRIVEYVQEIGQPVHLSLTVAELSIVIKVGFRNDTGQIISLGKFTNGLIDLVADIGFTPELKHIVKPGSFGDGNKRAATLGFLLFTRSETYFIKSITGT